MKFQRINIYLAAQKAGLIDKQAVERVAQSAKEDFEDLVSDPKVAKKVCLVFGDGDGDKDGDRDRVGMGDTFSQTT